MNGGTLQFTGGTGGASSESMGTLNLNSGASTIDTARGSAAANTQARTFGALVRSNGATVHFIDNNLGDDTRNRILFTAAPALTNNIIGAWAVVSNHWATYSADVSGDAGSQPSVTNLATAQYVSGNEAADWALGVNALLTVSSNLTGSRTINTLNMGDFDLNLGGNTLTVTGGGVLKSGDNNQRSLTNGIIRSGNGELVFWVLRSTLTNGLQIIDGTDGATTLVKSGAGTMRLTNDLSTFTGGVRINQGILDVSTDGQLGAVPGGPDADNIVLDGGVLRNYGTFMVNANRGVQLGANGNNANGGSERCGRPVAGDVLMCGGTGVRIAWVSAKATGARTGAVTTAAGCATPAAWQSASPMAAQLGKRSEGSLASARSTAAQMAGGRSGRLTARRGAVLVMTSTSISEGVGAANGSSPVRHSYSTMPAAQMSVHGPTLPFPEACSGAM